MNTNTIKSFAKEARIQLLDGVFQRLKYWGFNTDGTNSEKLEPTTGGYIFRGQVFTDSTVPLKWNNLKKRLTGKQAVNDIMEQAAYTWFNRLMAIKILEENGYIDEQLTFASGIRTPMIVQNAKHGRHELVRKSDKELLLEYLKEDKEELAFGLLVTNLCNRNKLLHDVFGRIDDFTEILLPQNLLQKNGLLDMINSNAITDQDYKEVELIGWLYQFYISDKKDEVFAGFKKNKKARAEDIPAATQIFTPKWIVKYMVENTVGKIYLDYEPDSSLRAEMKYLVENDSDKNNKPIISDITQLTLLDPASGSGHILVTGFDLLFKMYREEGYTAKQAVENILEHNLFGLDIDDRAMQLARFAVLLKAAQYDADVLNKGIIPHVYSFPEASHFTTEELQNFLGYDGHHYLAELKDALQLLNQGKNIGSAVKLELTEQAITHIEKQYKTWEKSRETIALDMQQADIWNRLKPFLDALLILTKQYIAVVANPPYMHRKNMNPVLKDFVFKYYPNTKTDLFAVFIEKCLDFAIQGGLTSSINQQSWMFISSYEKLREEIIENFQLKSLIHLGLHVFKELNTKVVQSTAFVFQKKKPTIELSQFYNLREGSNLKAKEILFLKRKNYSEQKQENFKKIPGTTIAYWLNEKGFSVFDHPKISEISTIFQGMITGDNNKFVRSWYEVNNEKISFSIENYTPKGYKQKYWCPYSKGGESVKWYGNQENVVNFYADGRNFTRGKYQFKDYFFKEYVTWSYISLSLVSRYFPTGFVWDVAGSGLFPNKKENLYPIVALLTSKVGNFILGVLNPTLNYQVENIAAVPFIDPSKELKTIITELSKKCIGISKSFYDKIETSWDFKKAPLLHENSSLCQAYQTWQKQVTEDFFQLHANEEELNRIFIEIYGLQEELTPEVKLKEITILQEELNRNALEQLEPVFRQHGKETIELPISKSEVLSQFISYCIGVIMGRYRLDKPGLNIAHPNPTEEELASYSYNGYKIEIDEDAILPLMGENCAFPDEALEQIKKLILAIWGENTLTENLNFLQNECLGMDLHKWLNEKFWPYHSGMYKKKPIYWLFCSNPAKPQKAAFKVLVYMHRMDRYTVQRIQRNYLHPHQEYIQSEIDRFRENEESLSRDEHKRFEMFENWKTECMDYNENLKNLALESQKEEIELDDGVSVNYVKFEGAVAKI